MCTFDIFSLFAAIPLDENIKICIYALYHTDIKPPPLSEDAFYGLMIMATKRVKFSFGNTIFKHVDGVAMGSQLGPVLANIFVGFHETIFFNESCSQDLPEWYRRYVDDTFSLFITEELARSFLSSLNNIHPSLMSTCEFENQRKLSF